MDKMIRPHHNISLYMPKMPRLNLESFKYFPIELRGAREDDTGDKQKMKEKDREGRRHRHQTLPVCARRGPS